MEEGSWSTESKLGRREVSISGVDTSGARVPSVAKARDDGMVLIPPGGGPMGVESFRNSSKPTVADTAVDETNREKS